MVIIAAVVTNHMIVKTRRCAASQNSMLDAGVGDESAEWFGKNSSFPIRPLMLLALV